MGGSARCVSLPEVVCQHLLFQPCLSCTSCDPRTRREGWESTVEPVSAFPVSQTEGWYERSFSSDVGTRAGSNLANRNAGAPCWSRGGLSPPVTGSAPALGHSEKTNAKARQYSSWAPERSSVVPGPPGLKAQCSFCIPGAGGVGSEICEAYQGLGTSELFTPPHSLSAPQMHSCPPRGSGPSGGVGGSQQDSRAVSEAAQPMLPG